MVKYKYERIQSMYNLDRIVETVDIFLKLTHPKKMKPVIENDHCHPRFWYASPPAIGPMNALKNNEMLRLCYFSEISIRVHVKKHVITNPQL